ncbi:uncharacterized protein sb:cb288 isoform X1 [Micropterus dolomieu]|uniref:uncharacterized protein sb:cb288 isoform X1 n=1 Tax=Micropterus dolomieu TaxID=147949 RepID=UPI001E8DF424|nr:uncharacterized protein sb:cb288 isoform X1 [Micropterus dolomieu]
MWTDVKNKSKTAINNGNSSKMIDADLLTRHLLHTVQQRNGSTAAVTHPSHTEGSSTRTSGIIPVCLRSDYVHKLLNPGIYTIKKRRHEKLAFCMPFIYVVTRAGWAHSAPPSLICLLHAT